MTIQEIEKLVSTRREELSKKYIKPKGYDYCKEFITSNPLKDPEDITKLDIWKCMICMYYIKSEDSIDDSIMLFSSFRYIFDEISSSELYARVNMMFDLENSDMIYDIIEYLDEDNAIKSKIILNKMAINDLELKEALIGIKEINEDPGMCFSNALKAMLNEPDAMIDTLSLLCTYTDMKEEIEEIRETITKSQFQKIKNKEKAKFINNYLLKKYQIKNIIAMISIINEFIQEEDLEEKQITKSTTRELNGLSMGMNILKNSLERQEIINVQDIAKCFQNEKIKHAVLELIYEHNMAYYNSLENELTELNKNTKSKYTGILKDAGIHPEKLDIESIMHNSVEDVETILISLKKFEFTEEAIIKILKNSNLEMVENIKEILSKGYLSVAFVCENIDIYYINSLKYSLLNENINLLNNYNINPHIFKNTPEVLFGDTNKLKNNIEILASYNLLKKLKTTNNYYFLISSNLELKLDRLIELGYEFVLEEDLSILNSDNLNRLEIVKLLNIELSTKEEVFEVLSSEKFYIRDEDISEYISNIVSLKKKQELNISKEELESFRLTPRSYSIGGNIISSIKVDRLLSNGNDLYDSIFSNTTLNSEEYDAIIKSIKDVPTK